MNPFVAAGAALLIVVVAGYVVITRREIARLPPLEKKSVTSGPKKTT